MNSLPFIHPGLVWAALALATVVAAGCGYAVSQRQTPVYEASVTILVGQPLQSAELNRADIQTSEMLAQTWDWGCRPSLRLTAAPRSLVTSK